MRETFQSGHAKWLQLYPIFATLWTVVHQAPLSIRFCGKNIGVGCHALLQGIFLTQGSCGSWIVGRFFTTEPPGICGVLSKADYPP